MRSLEVVEVIVFLLVLFSFIETKAMMTERRKISQTIRISKSDKGRLDMKKFAMSQGGRCNPRTATSFAAETAVLMMKPRLLDDETQTPALCIMIRTEGERHLRFSG